VSGGALNRVPAQKAGQVFFQKKIEFFAVVVFFSGLLSLLLWPALNDTLFLSYTHRVTGPFPACWGCFRAVSRTRVPQWECLDLPKKRPEKASFRQAARMDAMGLGEERKVVSAEVDGEESVWGELPAAAVGGDGVLVPNQGQKRKFHKK
jgi:hypothetical protein